jgi:hypothetical protein
MHERKQNLPVHHSRPRLARGRPPFMAAETRGRNRIESCFLAPSAIHEIGVLGRPLLSKGATEDRHKNVS